MSTDISNVYLPEGPDNSPLALIRIALEKGIDPDKMTMLYNLAERHREETARIAFAEAFNIAQGEMASVVADQKNQQTGTMFAKLEMVQKMAKPIWTAQGFSISFSEGDLTPTGLRTVILTCRHTGGHVETHKGHYSFDGEGPKGGRTMNPLQGAVSSNTYAHRDMLRQFWSIPIGGADQDGNNDDGFIDDAQTLELNSLLDRYYRKLQAAGGTEEGWEKWTKAYWAWLKCPRKMLDLKPGRFLEAKQYIEELLKGGKK